MAVSGGAPLVSVIMPVYKGERFLRQALDSIFAQTFGDLEVVAVNDGSPDTSRAILSEYADRVRIFDQEHDGPASARNHGIREARGQWLAFLDQDDLWEPNRLQRQLDQARPGDDLIHAECRVIDADGRIIQERFSTEPNETRTTLRRTIRHNPIYVPTVLVRRAAVERVGLLDVANRFGTDDYQLSLRLLATGHHCRYLDEVLASYRVHGGNTSADHGQMMRGEIYALERTRAEFPGGFAWGDRLACRRKLHELNLALGWRAVEAGARLEAARRFGAAIRNWPPAWRPWLSALAALPAGGDALKRLARRLAGRPSIVSEQDGWYG